jgi:hypothetical protein
LRAARLLPQSEKPVGRQSAPLACGEAACPAHPCVRASEDLRLYSTRKPVPNAGRLCQSGRRGSGGKVSSRCGFQAPSRSGQAQSPPTQPSLGFKEDRPQSTSRTGPLTPHDAPGTPPSLAPNAEPEVRARIFCDRLRLNLGSEKPFTSSRSG